MLLLIRSLTELHLAGKCSSVSKPKECLFGQISESGEVSVLLATDAFMGG
jgi:hypothetical protein